MSDLRLDRRRFLIGSALALSGTAAGTLLRPSPALATPASSDAAAIPAFTDVGVIPNYAVATSGADVVVQADGSVLVWASVGGSPATLAEIDPLSGTVVWQLPMAGAQVAWGVAGTPDGTVYAGSAPSGYVYRYVPGATSIELLGQPTPDTTYIWAMCTDEEGNAYGGTYTSSDGEGRVFSWNATTGQFRDYGPPVPNVAYVHAIAVRGGMIYAGTGPIAHVVEIDIQTGQVTDLGLPTGVSTADRFVEGLRVVGHYLLARAQNGGTTYAYDLAARVWTSLAVSGFGLATSQFGPHAEVYIDANGNLVAINPRLQTSQSTGGQDVGELVALEWITDAGGDDLLIGVNTTGAVMSYDPTSNTAELSQPPLTGALVSPSSLGEGPDGNVYIGGYPSGGLAAYDPASGTFNLTHRPFPQVEGMGSQDRTLYLGTYSGAQIWAYDPTQPWDLNTNPEIVLDLGQQNQDRPFAIVAAGSYVAIGTVPVYGALGGVLSLYDPATGDARTYLNVVSDQSVIALAYQDGVVYGGTSVWGGLGAIPTASDGVVFAVDVTTGDILWQVTPVPGDLAVSALTFGPDGALWGLTVGNLFRLDLQTLSVTVEAAVTEVDWASLDHYWQGGFLSYSDQTGTFYGATQGIVFAFDPGSSTATPLQTDTLLFLMHSSGNLYWTLGFDLIEATP